MCISVLDSYQHDDLFGDFVIIMNALLFPTNLMCTRHSISERLRTYLWFQPGSVKFYFILQVLLYTFKSCKQFKIANKYHMLSIYVYKLPLSYDINRRNNEIGPNVQ